MLSITKFRPYLYLTYKSIWVVKVEQAFKETYTLEEQEENNLFIKTSTKTDACKAETWKFLFNCWLLKTQLKITKVTKVWKRLIKERKHTDF